MATKKKSITKKFKGVPPKTQLAIVTGLVCLLVVFGVFVAWLDAQVGFRPLFKQSSSASFGDVTIRGERTCLQHKADGPHTMECAIGIKTPSGDYQVIGSPVESGANTLQAHGTLSSPSDDSRYQAQGVITVK